MLAAVPGPGRQAMSGPGLIPTRRRAPRYRPAGSRALNFPAARLVGVEYEAVLVAAGSKPFACGVQGTPSPLRGVGWDEGPQAGELFTQVPHIARYIVRHAGYHAEGTGPGHPDIWVPPTAL